MDWLTGNVVSTGGLGSLLGGVLVAIFRGWLVPKSTVDRMTVSYDRQLADWKATADAARAQADMLLAQQQKLMEIAYLTRDAATRRLEGLRDETA